MNKHILLSLCLVGLGACSHFVLPKVQADNVDCTYHREYNDITWNCDVKGTGEPASIGIF